MCTLFLKVKYNKPVTLLHCGSHWCYLHFLLHVYFIYSVFFFQEFMKEVDAKSSLKSSLISTGNQLLQVKQADTASLQNQLAQFEQGWTEVLTPLPGIQEKLHQVRHLCLFMLRKSKTVPCKCMLSELTCEGSPEQEPVDWSNVKLQNYCAHLPRWNTEWVTCAICITDASILWT